MYISELKARINETVDIVEIIREFIDLKPGGSTFKGLCPFHVEKTPSFIVDRSRQRYKCFGCGRSGDVIQFIIDHKKMSFPEAIAYLADEFSIPTNKGIVSSFPALRKRKPGNQETSQEINFLPFEVFDLSMRNWKDSDLYPFLRKLFTTAKADDLCNNYFVGATKDGLTAFWYVDIEGRVRQVKVIPYRPDGHRDKNKVITSYVDNQGELQAIRGAFAAGKFLLRQLGTRDAVLKYCLFGEYLLSFPENNNKPIAIFESEKTCIIASIYFPQYVCLATGGKHGAKLSDQNVSNVLQGREVILFPDLGAYDDWKTLGYELRKSAKCHVSIDTVLEKIAQDSERSSGLDIADYLLRKTDPSGLALSDLSGPNIDPYPAIWIHPNDFLFQRAA